jgi:hypothetical protein
MGIERTYLNANDTIHPRATPLALVAVSKISAGIIQAKKMLAVNSGTW